MSNSHVKDWKKFKENTESPLPDELDMTAEDKPVDPNEEATSTSSDEWETKYQAVETERQNLEAQVLRLGAEAANIRRRLEMDVTNAHRYGTEKFVTNLLPVVDSLEQALDLTKEHGDNSMSEGLKLTHKLLMDTLEKQGVVLIHPEGAMFDPKEHEAIMVQDRPDLPAGQVISIFQKGYMLNQRVIRPARVIVAKGGPSAESTQ